jgi:hypothetical protein
MWGKYYRFFTLVCLIVTTGMPQQSDWESESERPWVVEVIVLTRHWIHYGTMLFVFFVTLAAAAEGLLTK